MLKYTDWDDFLRKNSGIRTNSDFKYVIIISNKDRITWIYWVLKCESYSVLNLWPHIKEHFK